MLSSIALKGCYRFLLLSSPPPFFKDKFGPSFENKWISITLALVYVVSSLVETGTVVLKKMKMWKRLQRDRQTVNRRQMTRKAYLQTFQYNKLVYIQIELIKFVAFSWRLIFWIISFKSSSGSSFVSGAKIIFCERLQKSLWTCWELNHSSGEKILFPFSSLAVLNFFDASTGVY